MYGKEGEISIAGNDNEHHKRLVSYCGGGDGGRDERKMLPLMCGNREKGVLGLIGEVLGSR